uniref:Uncharacterized protein n=1 Tax=Rhizophora mucronata TaxID=61149 RepID=A0A2P2QUM8_RHIMU
MPALDVSYQYNIIHKASLNHSFCRNFVTKFSS